MYGDSQVRSRQATSRSQKGSTFRHFRRLLGYVWPHKRYLLPALLCMLVMALAYSASIGSILPVLKIMVEDEGLHGWVDKHIAESRLECEFATYDPELHRKVPDLRPGTAIIRTLKVKSPLREQGDLRQGDFILAVDGVRGHAIDLFHQLAGAGTLLEITFRPADEPKERMVSVAVPPHDPKYAALHRAIGLIPGGRTPSARTRTLVVVLGFLLVLVLVGNMARVCAEYLSVLVNSRAIIDLRRQMYGHVLKLPLSRFSENTSDTMSKFVQDMNDIFRGLNNFFQKVVAEPFKAAGVVVIALMLNWRLTLLLMLGAPLAVFLFRRLGRKIRRANRKLLMGYGRMLGRLESTLVGMRVVKAYARETYERRQLFMIDRSVLRQQLKMGFIEALTSPLVETLAFIAGAVAILYFARGIFTQDVSPSEFMTMVLCLGAIFDPLRKLSTVYPKLQRANAAAERVFELIDSPSEYDHDAGRPAVVPLRRVIEFDNVSFTYPGAGRPAVRNLSLTVNKKEILALVGPNGSGKTTLLSLLPRFFPLDGGRILIDGQDINQVTLRSLREQFSLITQESVIFPDTVRANIAYGKPSATEAEIRSAARKAFADEFIQQMPAGYDSLVGEHGATLSGGQRQRLAIARAILRDAPILIFDEATSQVDPESELKIHQALDAFLKDRTAFIIAHRYSTVSGADRIAVMDDGELVAVGTHEHLLKSCPLYYRLYETQFRHAG